MSNTRTLSSVLAELLKTQSSTDDHIIVTSGGKTYYVTPAELPTANSEQNGQMSKETYNTIATQVVRIDEINGKLGEPFDRLMIRYRAFPNFETIDKFNNCLDVSLMDEQNQGVCVVPVFGIPMLVVTAQTFQEKNVWMQTLFGCVSVAKGGMSIADAGGKGKPYVQLVRYANSQTPNTGWGAWESINPSEQTSVNGTSKNYVYSKGKSEDTKTLITSKFWIYQHSDGNAFLRFKHYGATNDKNETDYSQVQIPNAWVGANGLIRRDIYSRLDSFALREENSTATQVNIVTPIFTTGGTRTLTISRATSAKAGVMSAIDKVNLDNIVNFARDLGNYSSEDEALDALKDVGISGNSNIVHALCTYGDKKMSITMMQSIENDYCRQIIFNKSKLYQRAIYFTNGERTEISYAEDWSFLSGDRLSWDSENNKYSLCAFDTVFNQAYCDPIPLSDGTIDGLMSKATYNTLATQVKKIKELEQQIIALQERIAKLENK
jgi:hypothetical protein|nr:MAG TPA: Receptor recognition protein, Long tail, Helical sandwich, Tail fiber [Caudoviricetes sp.]